MRNHPSALPLLRITVHPLALIAVYILLALAYELRLLPAASAFIVWSLALPAGAGFHTARLGRWMNRFPTPGYFTHRRQIRIIALALWITGLVLLLNFPPTPPPLPAPAPRPKTIPFLPPALTGNLGNADLPIGEANSITTPTLPPSLLPITTTTLSPSTSASAQNPPPLDLRTWCHALPFSPRIALLHVLFMTATMALAYLLLPVAPRPDAQRAAMLRLRWQITILSFTIFYVGLNVALAFAAPRILPLTVTLFLTSVSFCLAHETALATLPQAQTR